MAAGSDSNIGSDSTAPQVGVGCDVDCYPGSDCAYLDSDHHNVDHCDEGCCNSDDHCD